MAALHRVVEVCDAFFEVRNDSPDDRTVHSVVHREHSLGTGRKARWPGIGGVACRLAGHSAANRRVRPTSVIWIWRPRQNGTSVRSETVHHGRTTIRAITPRPIPTWR